MCARRRQWRFPPSASPFGPGDKPRHEPGGLSESAERRRLAARRPSRGVSEVTRRKFDCPVQRTRVRSTTSRPVRVLLVKPLLLVVQIHGFAFDEEQADLGGGLEGVAICNHEVGPFAFFNGTDAVADTPNL